MATPIHSVLKSRNKPTYVLVKLYKVTPSHSVLKSRNKPTYVLVKLYKVTPNHNVPKSRTKYNRLTSLSQTTVLATVVVMFADVLVEIVLLSQAGML